MGWLGFFYACHLDQSPVTGGVMSGSSKAARAFFVSHFNEVYIACKQLSYPMGKINKQVFLYIT